MDPKKFYITTPIYYATAKPHIGSLYSTVLADVIARWNFLCGKEVFFLTGTDEHGNKIAVEAAKAGLDPQSFVDKHVPEYRRVWKEYHIQYSQFIRTTDSEHRLIVQKIIARLMAQGDIYEGLYQGWYCVPCETFVVEKEVQDPACPSCGRQTQWLSEQTYFFAVSKYQDRLKKWLHENPHWIIPHERAHEINSFLEQNLQDLSITRTKMVWGIPFPQATNHVLYVWIEALCNYITALGYDPETNQFKKEFWPCTLHILGKDIIRFHAIYWPILLMALDLPLPKNLLVHGWIKVGGQKMSKSLGNAVDPDLLLQEYGADVVRYILIRYVPINQDAEFSKELINAMASSDLADDLGNLVQRVTLLAQKYEYCVLRAPERWSAKTDALQKSFLDMVHDVDQLWKSYQLHMMYGRIWIFIKQVNAYFHDQAPWKQIKDDVLAFEETLSATAHCLLRIAWYIWPVMPQKAEEIFKFLGSSFENIARNARPFGQIFSNEIFTLNPINILFPKSSYLVKENAVVQKEKIENEIAHATLDDLKKCQIAVGVIDDCVIVEKSEKLFSLSVNCGAHGKRTILTNIRQFYTPEQLIGKQALFMLNLKPRPLMGIVSEGMILCVSNDCGKPVLVSPEMIVAAGSLIG